jgi:Phage regulatory protein CII (CP76)
MGRGGQARPTMQSHELLKEVLKKTSAKQIAAEMSLSLSLIYKWAEPPDEGAGSGANNPLDRIEQLLRITNDARIAQWVCELAGGFFITNPKVKPDNQQLIPSTNSIVQEFADMLGVIAVAASDNQITKAESKDIRRRWEDLKSVTEGFVRHCEQGDFIALKEAAIKKA